MDSNAAIARHLRVKPHTVARWRKAETWDDLLLKIDRRAAELFVEKIANDRGDLNIRHYRLWEALLTKLVSFLQRQPEMNIRDLERIAGIVERSQKGQRLAKGLSTSGDTEEAIRAQSEAELRTLIDLFIETIQEHITDEKTRDNIRRQLLGALPQETGTGVGRPGDARGQ
jgi:hypothetical protein